MNEDIRVLTTFPRHPKTIKLKRLLGTWEPIITLWLWAAENRPGGDLSGLEEEDIAIACGFDGDPKALIEALASVKFIEEINGAYVLHDWKKHNAFCAYAELRKEKAILAAKARWDRRLNICSNDAKSMRVASAEHNQKMLQAPAPSPSPSPSPTRKEKKKRKVEVAFDLSSLPVPDWVDLHSWEDFIQHRKDIKKPLSELAAKKSLQLLSLYRDQQREIIDTSIRNGWQGLFPPKVNSHSLRNNETQGPRKKLFNREEFMRQCNEEKKVTS